MKAVMLTFMLCLMLPMSSTMESTQPKSIPLSMMAQSVDDMYSGCTIEMDQKVQRVYFPTEMKNELFRKAWEKEESCAQNKYKIRPNKEITKDHVQALCVYTDKDTNVYAQLNAAVRVSAAKYSTPSFQYHALHFWLTSAIQILNVNKQCQTTYRKTPDIYTGNVNEVMRFGYFTSSSKKTNLGEFGKETCFHIKTCLGAYIKEYSVYPKEEEVLIPPYEQFKITKIVKGSYKDLKDCKTIFVLESVGHLSNLNCKAARKLRQFDLN